MLNRYRVVTCSLVATSVLCLMAKASTLTGTVTDSDGDPLQGAVVSIYTAKPKTGRSATCPSCYRDCAKSTKTKSDGSFAIESLDDSLLFRVLVVAPATRPVLTDHVDPGEKPLVARLSPRPDGLKDENYLRGRVVDGDGKPVAEAVVDPYGAKTTRRRWWGRMKGVDPLVVTDADGKFVVVSDEPKLAMDLKVKGRNFATKITPLLELNGEQHTIALEQGASVSGRLVYEGKPVADRSVGIVQSERGSGQFVGEQTRVTDADGQFSFFNLLPSEEYVFYTLCDGDASTLTLKRKKLNTPDDQKSVDLGDVELIKGLKISGRVQLSEGQFPPDATLRISRNPAWDWKTVTIATDGSFNVTGLPPEVYKIKLEAAGVKIDNSRFRYQMVGPNEFGLKLGESRAEFVIPASLKETE